MILGLYKRHKRLKVTYSATEQTDSGIGFEVLGLTGFRVEGFRIRV